MRRVAVATGTRAEYGLLRSTLEAIAAEPRLEARVLATGMHLDPRFGPTIEEVRRDHPDLVEVPWGAPGDGGADMARGLARGLAGFVDAFEAIRPDVLVVLGDRAEPMAAALAAAHQKIAIAHVHGGDVSRCGIDDSLRHAITQLAHVHFPATDRSAGRIRRMGQAAWRIHVVGAPGLDALRTARIAPPEEVRARAGLAPDRPYAVVLHNPDTTCSGSAGPEVEAILAALASLPLDVVALQPNSDAGHGEIVDRLERAAAAGAIRLVSHLERPVFLGLVSGSAALVGNSSCGIIEAPALGVPFVEVGTRQAGRERGANVLPAPAEARAVLARLREAMEPGFRRGLAGAPHPYGDGRAGERIARVLAELEIDERLMQKGLDLP